MPLYDTTLTDTPLAPRPRDLAAALLRTASRTLDRLAVRLAAREAPPAPETDLEFYAEAGAPEGVVYVNGRLAGYLPGVQRL